MKGHFSISLFWRGFFTIRNVGRTLLVGGACSGLIDAPMRKKFYNPEIHFVTFIFPIKKYAEPVTGVLDSRPHWRYVAVVSFSRFHFLRLWSLRGPMAELDPGIAQFLWAIKNSNLPRYWRLPVADARKMVRDGNKFNNGPIPAGAVISSFEIPRAPRSIPIRLYRPDSQPADKVLPVLLYFHGGGFVINRPEDLDVLCILLCQATDCLIASVDYRLAPEHPFPDGLEDVFMALQWVQQNAREIGGDPTHIAVGGDSAGGNLAAVCAQLNRDQNGPDLAFHYCIIPTQIWAETIPHVMSSPPGITWNGKGWSGS